MDGAHDGVAVAHTDVTGELVIVPDLKATLDHISTWRPIGEPQVRTEAYFNRLSGGRRRELFSGEVSEWLKEPVSKTGVALVVTVGSNPTLSALIAREASA